MAAWAHVPSEDKENWAWMLKNCVAAFPRLNTDPESVVVSDRDKGLRPAVAECVPGTYHRNCAKHLEQHVQKLGGRAAVGLFWAAVKTPSRAHLDLLLVEMSTKFPAVHAYLTSAELPVSSWAIATSPRPTWGKSSTTISEGNNAVYLSERSLPPPMMMQQLLDKTHERFIRTLLLTEVIL
jgi:hypothetical protein